MVCRDPFRISGFSLIAAAPSVVENFRQDGVDVDRMTDKGNVAVAVDDEQCRNPERGAGIHPKLVHFARTVEPDSIVQI
ncbi:hypothetical protein ABIB94_007952 [Bradyrhizobium sp. JR7.2]|uniref:hypothetical protein n=1 Tax=unclassified Bradyrhizobium TaxID=2631580 RepID=UPI003391C114